MKVCRSCWPYCVVVCVLCICGTPREKLNIMSVMYFKRITEFDRLKCLRKGLMCTIHLDEYLIATSKKCVSMSISLSKSSVLWHVKLSDALEIHNRRIFDNIYLGWPHNIWYMYAYKLQWILRKPLNKIHLAWTHSKWYFSSETLQCMQCNYSMARLGQMREMYPVYYCSIARVQDTVWSTLG